ncbi:MAG: hypothetical protein E7612_00220 [Ruminococcaceae bacterium]|nr:hypothetical protein [Oscillospiraceae bacterium]
MKVLLILVDGMRGDSLENCKSAQEFMKKSSYTLNAQTVMPSATLPCHMSLFHSVDPVRHGTATNAYAPQVRPIKGLCEMISAAGKRNAFFYNWEQLRDLSRPSAQTFSYCVSIKRVGFELANKLVTDAAISHLSGYDIDFCFLYLGVLDEVGHKFGWMTPEYFAEIESSWAEIDRIVAALPEDYTVIVTADHGGHDRTHGTEMPEDMTIPVFIKGKDFTPGELFENVSIKDIAPTVAKLLDVPANEEWEGVALF